MTILICIVWTGLALGRSYLATNLQISFLAWEYDFPSTLHLYGINAQPTDTLSLQADGFHVTWHWSDLWRRQGIHIRDVAAEGLNLQVVAINDTIACSADQLLLTRANLADVHTLDSIVLRGPQVRYYLGDTTQQSGAGDTTSFRLDDLPGLTLTYLEIDSGSLTLQTPTRVDRIDHLQLAVAKLSSSDLLSVSLEHLSLDYQDTLSIGLRMDRGTMSRDLTTLVDGLHIDLPGLSLQTNGNYSINDQSGELQMDPSYISVGLIRRLVPESRKWLHAGLDDRERISLLAHASFDNQQITIDELRASILDSTQVELKGTINHLASPIAFQVPQLAFESTRANLLELVAPQEVFESIIWPTRTLVSVEAFGNADQFNLSTEVLTPSGAITSSGTATLSPSMAFHVQTDVRSLKINEIVRDLPVCIPSLSLVSDLDVRFRGDSLYSLTSDIALSDLQVEDFEVDTIRALYRKSPGRDSISLAIVDDQLHAAILGRYEERDTSLLELSVSAAANTEGYTAISDYLEHARVGLSASYEWHGNSYADGQITFDTLGVKVPDLAETVVAGTALTYSKQDSLNRSHLQFADGQYANVIWRDPQAADTLDLLSIIQHMDVKFWLDSALHGSFGEEQWALEMDTFQLDMNEGHWDASWAMPHLSFGDYALDSLIYSFGYANGAQRGTLSAAHLVNPLLQDLSLQLNHNGSLRDTDVLLEVMIKESQQEIRLPLRFETLANGYAVGFADSLPLTQPDLKWHGVTDEFIVFDKDLSEVHGRLQVMARSDKEPSVAELFVNHSPGNTVLDVLLEHVDIEPIKKVVHWPQDLALTGTLYSDVHLTYRDTLAIKGYLAIDESLLQLPESKTVIKLSEDFIDFDGRELSLRDFVVYDEQDNPLTINGTVQVMEENVPFDLTVEGDRFIMIQSEERSGHFAGHLSSRASLHATGDMDEINISGDFEILPDARLTYYPEETAEIVSTHSSISFIDFSDSTALPLAPPPVTHAINWDVEFILNETDFEIILDEESQEFVRFFANGTLELVKGEDELPGIFGTIESTKGRAFIGLPTVSDINMIIDQLNVRFDGDVSNPKITFVGHENFHLSPAALDVAFANKQRDVNFKVIFKLDEATPETIDVNFDLTSDDPDVNDFLRSKPPDTRTTYAINILAFGALEMFGDGGSDFSIVASKLNELAHRNIKHADVFFQASDVRNEDGTRERTDFKYSVSKSFLKNRLSVALGGTLGKELAEGEVADLLDDVEVNYLLKKDPMLSAKGTHKHRFDDVFDGEVQETTIGLHFLKRFRLKKRKEEPQ